MELTIILLFGYILIAVLVFACLGYRSKYNDLKGEHEKLIGKSNSKITVLNNTTIENENLKAEMVLITGQFRSYKGAIAYVNRSYEELTRKYILQRIQLFQFQYPDYDGPSEMLYRLDDLKQANVEGKLNSIDYLQEIDEIFNELQPLKTNK